MTLEEIRARVAAIDTSDPEVAHGEEDDIRHDVLVHIAQDEGAPDHVRDLALAALSTATLEFDRWYA